MLQLGNCADVHRFKLYSRIR